MIRSSSLSSVSSRVPGAGCRGTASSAYPVFGSCVRKRVMPNAAYLGTRWTVAPARMNTPRATGFSVFGDSRGEARENNRRQCLSGPRPWTSEDGRGLVTQPPVHGEVDSRGVLDFGPRPWKGPSALPWASAHGARPSLGKAPRAGTAPVECRPFGPPELGNRPRGLTPTAKDSRPSGPNNTSKG